MNRLGSCLVVAALWTTSAHAEVTDATRAAARELGYAGVESYQAGSYQVAYDKLDKAYQVLNVPSLGLWSARALIKLNRWVEAAERLRQVLRLAPQGGDADVQQQSLQEAKHELDALTPRIPSLVIQVEELPVGGAQVTVDGDIVATALLGEPLPTNPGRHAVVVQFDSRSLRREVLVQAGKQERVVLHLSQASAGTGPSSPTAPAPASDGHPSSTRKTIGWALVGTGGAGLLLGATTGILALTKKKALEDSSQCQGHNCLRTQTDDVNSYNSFRLVSGVGLIAGAALAATGVVLIASTPTPARDNQPVASHVWLKASPASLTVGGKF